MIDIDWLNFEIDEKIYKRLLIFGIVVIVAYLAITYMSLSIPRIYHVDKDTVIDTESVVKTGINSMHRGKMRLKLSGWAYKEGQDVEIFNSSYVLKNKKSGQMYITKTSMTQIPELQDVNESNCLNCGLEAQSVILGLQDGIYEIHILYKNDNENLLVNTGIEVEI